MLFFGPQLPGSGAGPGSGGTGIGSGAAPGGLGKRPLGIFGVGAGRALAELQPHSAINERFQFVAAAANVAYKVPEFSVSPGLTVTLFGFNGSANNAKQLTFGEQWEVGKPGQHYLAAGEALAVPVDDLGEIWWMAAQAGDGLLITVTGESVG